MLESIKEEMDLESFFIEMGASKLRATTNGYKMSCLYPNHRDSNPSFYYNSDNHKFKCHGCGAFGDIIDIVQEVKELGFHQSIRWIKNFTGFSTEVGSKELESLLDRRLKVYNERDEIVEISLPVYFENDFTVAEQNIKDYVAKRGWDVQTIHNLGIGYCEHGFFRDRVIVPVYDEYGRLMTFVARAAWNCDHEDRYKYPLKSLLSRSIWGLHKRLDGVPIFVEGFSDALRLRMYGYNAYAVLGNQLGDVKLEMIRNLFSRHEKIIVIPDGDAGGDVLKNWFKKLIHQFKVHFVDLREFGEKVDVDDLGSKYGKKMIDRVVKSAISYQDMVVKTPKKNTKILTELVGVEDVYDNSISKISKTFSKQNSKDVQKYFLKNSFNQFK